MSLLIFRTVENQVPRSKRGINADDIQPVDYRNTEPASTVGRLQDVDILWPRSSMLGTDYANIAPIWDNNPQRWEWYFPPTGHHSRKKVTGVTRDSGGAALGGVTVNLYNTSTGVLVDTVVSDSLGVYEASDPNNVNSFAVGYKTGAPDVAGTTQNNLTGT